MSWTLRCRGPQGQATLSGVDAESSVAQFQKLLHEKTGVLPARQELLAGFPPKPLLLPDNRGTAPISSLTLCNGESVTVRELPPPPAATPPAASAAAPLVASASQSQQQDGTAAAATADGSAAVGTSGLPSATYGSMELDDDPELAMALAASLADSHRPPSGTSAAAPGSSSDVGISGQRAQPTGPPRPAPTSVPLADGSGCAVVRRVIDSDNSCLFNAVGYVMEHSRSQAQQLRQVIARVVAGDPDTYNEGFLGKTNKEYCEWITQPDKWGGAIELSILARHYGREIAAYDLQTKRVDVYGQDAGYPERAMLLYDGLHYDAMAVAAFEGAPEDLDISIFNPASQDGAAIAVAADKLTAASHEARAFTDMATFTLRCGVCQVGLKGEKEAVEHAKATSHQNFVEYH